MRLKDDIKQEALFEATVTVVNEIGFAASSVSKIAKAAKVSPATLYVYHGNKEELLVYSYVRIKEFMSQFLLHDFDETAPIYDCLKQLWINIFAFAQEHSNYFQYIEQFSNCPFRQLVDVEEVEAFFAPFFRVMDRGIAEKIIKDVDFEILAAFIYHPVTLLAKPQLCSDFKLTREAIESAFQLAWDAVKR
ncbi:MAG: TetR/AcrR family transcriptional regulator [Desulfobacterales bacterium]|nr:TetR/AcrR family transcriptional regulator [Desulfobacterales bacterium]